MNNITGKISRAQRYKIKYKYPLFLSENNFGNCVHWTIFGNNQKMTGQQYIIKLGNLTPVSEIIIKGSKENEKSVIINIIPENHCSI